jgi:uncharacterized protein (DUF4415 family)
MKRQKTARTGRPAAGKRARAKTEPATASMAKKSRKESNGNKADADILKMYRPLKKPITVRIDADVLAWFKKDGSRYQTRINSALRQFMEREMKVR